MPNRAGVVSSGPVSATTGVDALDDGWVDEVSVYDTQIVTAYSAVFLDGFESGTPRRCHQRHAGTDSDPAWRSAVDP
jgi:hypothetical protein